jgi:hypothetical protein
VGKPGDAPAGNRSSHTAEKPYIRGNNHELISFLEVKVGRYISSSLSMRKKKRMNSIA